MLSEVIFQQSNGDTFAFHGYLSCSQALALRRLMAGQYSTSHEVSPGALTFPKEGNMRFTQLKKGENEAPEDAFLITGCLRRDAARSARKYLRELRVKIKYARRAHSTQELRAQEEAEREHEEEVAAMPWEYEEQLPFEVVIDPRTGEKEFRYRPF